MTQRRWQVIRSKTALAQTRQELQTKLATKIRDLVAQGAAHHALCEQRIELLDMYNKLLASRGGVACGCKSSHVAALLTEEVRALLEMSRSYTEKLQDVCTRQGTSNLQIFVRQLTGKGLVMTPSPQSTVLSLKREVEERTSIPERMFYLFYGLRVLAEDSMLEDCELCHDTTIHMALRSRVIMARCQLDPGQGQPNALEGR
eukprot:1575029-Amphidinium_carterae.1